MAWEEDETMKITHGGIEMQREKGAEEDGDGGAKEDCEPMRFARCLMCLRDA